ncbi:hypothetical protein DL767_004263 [Monosporascus sp. MG133]|nr:hypothetical protein DL767_004263 [Monosporascus sp. MG133]
MGFLKRTLILGLATSAVKAQGGTPNYTQPDIDSGKALQDLSRIAKENALKRLSSSSSECTADNVRVRKEWHVNPLRLSSQNVLTPSRSMFDSFGLLHYYQTPYVHNSVYFLLFHRVYIWLFEEKLRTVCGYTGTFPYWEWGLDCGGVEQSPLFDGSPTSMGGNGERVNGSQGMFPGGTGGGCVKEGPFSNYTVNLGPLTARNPLAHNPRCLKRDLNTQICRASASLKNTTEVMLESPNVELFQANLQGDFRYPESRKWGFSVHGGGHFIIAGDPGSDFYFSPLEPAFYLHHGQIDRMYFVWQNIDWENRQDVAGTITMMNRPPSRNGTLDDVVDMEPLGGAYTLGEMLDTTNGNTPTLDTVVVSTRRTPL